MYGCVGLRELPPTIGDLASLLELDLSNCSSLQLLPTSFGEAQAGGWARMTHTPTPGLPTSTVACRIRSGHDLMAARPNDFASHPGVFAGLNSPAACLCSLERLNIAFCQSLAALPDDFGELQRLVVLDARSESYSPYQVLVNAGTQD